MNNFRKSFKLLAACAICACGASAFAVELEAYTMPQNSVMVYARKPVRNDYSNALAGSIHFAVSTDGKNYTAMHDNYGLVFATSVTPDDRSAIRTKAIKNPWIFAMDDDDFGVVAVRTKENGSNDDDSKGKLLFWKTDDFIEFDGETVIDLKKDVYVDRAQVARLADGTYRIDWVDADGNAYRSTSKNLKSVSDPVSAEKPAVPEFTGTLPFNAIPGNAVSVNQTVCDAAMLHWSKLYSIAANVPKTITAKSADDVNSVNAQIIYSDGSTATKPVVWDTASVDFSKPGEYTVSGKIQNDEWKFPLDKDFGDPVIFPWEGMMYFIGTTDARGNIGFYVREGKTVDEIFAKGNKEYKILDRDERRLLLQTFWAPEFHFIGNELYILFAVSGRSWGPQCHMMKFKKGGKITDPASWEDPVKVVRKDGSPLAPDGISLDMTYFKAGKKCYLSWSYRKGIGSPNDTGSMVYIASIDPAKPWQLASDPVLLTRPLYGWENVDGTINNEGPYAFVHGGKVYLTYSGGSANKYTYAVGLLTADEDDDLLDLDNWTKARTPVLQYYSIEGVWGPGHNSFFQDGKGNLFIAYHGEEALNKTQRCDGIHRIHFNVEGEPVFDMSAERDLATALRAVTMKVIVK